MVYVFHAPQKQNEYIAQNAKYIRGLRPHVVGFTEIDMGLNDNTRLLSTTFGRSYQLCTGHYDKSHSREVPVMVKVAGYGVRYKVTKVTVHRLSQDLGQGIGNDRHMTVVRYQRKRLLKGRRTLHAHIQTHWNAALQDKATGALLHNERVRVMDQEAGPQLEAAIVELQGEGRRITVAGDFNYRPPDKGVEVWHNSPQRIFMRTGLQYTSQWYDYLAWSKDQLPRRGWPQTIAQTATVNHSDHPWLHVRLRGKK